MALVWHSPTMTGALSFQEAVGIEVIAPMKFHQHALDGPCITNAVVGRSSEPAFLTAAQGGDEHRAIANERLPTRIQYVWPRVGK
jgi:hypothetical protein